MPTLLTVPEFSEALRISVKTTRQWVLARKVFVVHIGRCVRIPASEVQRIIDEGSQPAREAVSR